MVQSAPLLFWRKEVELRPAEADALTAYLSYYRPLIGDQRTLTLFQGTIRGIIGAESLVCARIAAQSPDLAARPNSAQRIRRMARQKTTQRSDLDADSLVGRLRQHSIEQLQGEDELWVLFDGSDLRKPHAREMEGLQRVKTLDKQRLTNGYRTLNAVAIGRTRRGILYHRLFSKYADDFISEPREVQTALHSMIDATQPLQATVIYAMDSGLDDIAVWSTIWEANQHLVCRLQHMDRLVEQRDVAGQWEQTKFLQACAYLREYAMVETELVVRKHGQRFEKRQKVTARVSACPLRVRYQVDVRTKAHGAQHDKSVWLVRVVLEDVPWEPWYLLTDLPVTDAESATKVFRIYRQRWAVEDAFKVTKQCLGWEEVQVLTLDAVRTLVALAWVAAGFVYELGVTFEDAEVRLLARLGGWEQRKDRHPGKIILMRGLRRLLDMAAAEAILADEIAAYGQLPPRLAAMLNRQVS
jgi:hypothetical protein